MPETPDTSDTRTDVDTEPAGEQVPGTPRWVKIFGLVVLVLLALFLVLKLVGGGEHGPGRHGGGGGDAPPAGATDEGGHTPPPGIDHGQPRP